MIQRKSKSADMSLLPVAFRAMEDYKFAWHEMALTLRKKQGNVVKRDRIEVPAKWDERAPLVLLPNNHHLKGNLVWAFFTRFLEKTGMRCGESSEGPRSLYSTRHSFNTHLQTGGVLTASSVPSQAHHQR